jgi:hypothetical protein
MTDQNWMTDEDKMIHHYTVHRDLVGWVIQQLESQGIVCERTRGNDPGGDILYHNPEDEPRVKEIIREINDVYNSNQDP